MKPLRHLLTALITFTFLIQSPLAWSETKVKKVTKKRPPVGASETIKIVYASSPWNKESTKMDSAYLFMKDSKNGKTAKILLEETEPDSSTFSGYFSISWDAEGGELAPEIYIPPQTLRGEVGLKRFHFLLKEGRLSRRPIVVRKDENGMQVVDVYDTKDQAKEALKAYQEEIRLEKAKKKKELTKPIPSETTLEAAKLAEKKALMEQLAMEAAKRESERIRLAQIEKQKAEERLRRQKMLAEKERQERMRRAQELADQALTLYKEGKFKEAEELFRQSVDLDPSNKSYYFRYGVTLYRNEKYNEALVTLKMADVNAQLTTEKKYYMALTHYRLKELDNALNLFREVKVAKAPVISPSAAFYEGLILFSQEEYDKAEAPFQFVLDNSQDARLDEKAEDYIEKILALKQFKKKQEKRTTLSATVGANYDSNILLAPDNETSQGSTTDGADLRGLLTASAEYRMIYERKHEWSTKISSMGMMTRSSDLSRADPTLATLSLPYSYKGTVGSKGYKLTVNPGYELLYMDPTSSGTQSNILRSAFLSTDNTFIMSKKWFSSYILDIRQDDSLLADSIGPNDSDAIKIGLKTKQTVFRDKAKKQAIISSFGLVYNMAKGDNKAYYRVEGGVTYMSPTNWDAIWTGGLNAYHLIYPSASEERKDTNLTIMTGISKPVKEWFMWGVNANYSVNNSTNDDNQYSKYSIMTTATFNYTL